MVSWRPGGRRIGAAAAAAAALTVALHATSSAQAATAPSDAAPSCWFQTNGPEITADKGDWYTSTLNPNPDRRHVFQIMVPAGAAFPVTLRVLDAESRPGKSEHQDEVLNTRDPTRFTLEQEDGSILAQETFSRFSPANSIFETTIEGPGTYRLISKTGALPISGNAAPGLNDDQNSFRIRVVPDGARTPDSLDDVRIEFTQATIACTQDGKSLALAYSVPEGTTETTLRNFDLDAPGQAWPLKYTAPAGEPTDWPASGEAVWAEKIVPIGPGEDGRWTIAVHRLQAQNQVGFEAWAGGDQLPLSVVNRPPAWRDPSPVARSEPIELDPVPIIRSIRLTLEDPDDGQTLFFSVVGNGHCELPQAPHPFESVTFGSDSVVTVPGLEQAELLVAVGARDEGVHCVRARVRNGSLVSDLEFMVTVTGANSAPIAEAGPAQIAHEPGDAVTLSGAGSSDPDGDAVTLTWRQREGPAVVAVPPGDPLVIAPEVSGSYAFELTVDDGEYTSTDTALVTVRNGAPIVRPPSRKKVGARRRVAIPIGSFTDPGPDGPWRVHINWGDRTRATRWTVEEPGALGRARHRFRRGGFYRVTVRVTDQDDATGIGRFNVRVRPPCVVPNVKGKTLKAARRALKRRHCQIGRVTRAFSGRVRAGRVISHKPGTKKVRPTGARVKVKMSKGQRR